MGALNMMYPSIGALNRGARAWVPEHGEAPLAHPPARSLAPPPARSPAHQLAHPLGLQSIRLALSPGHARTGRLAGQRQ